MLTGCVMIKKIRTAPEVREFICAQIEFVGVEFRQRKFG